MLLIPLVGSAAAASGYGAVGATGGIEVSAELGAPRWTGEVELDLGFQAARLGARAAPHVGSEPKWDQSTPVFGADTLWGEFHLSPYVRIRGGLDTPPVGVEGSAAWERPTWATDPLTDERGFDTFAGGSLVYQGLSGTMWRVYGGLPVRHGILYPFDSSELKYGGVAGASVTGDFPGWSTWSGIQVSGLEVEARPAFAFYPHDLVTLLADGSVRIDWHGDVELGANVTLVLLPRAVVGLVIRTAPRIEVEDLPIKSWGLWGGLSARVGCVRVSAEAGSGTPEWRVFSGTVGVTAYMSFRGAPLCVHTRLLDAPQPGATETIDPDLALTNRRLFGDRPW